MILILFRFLSKLPLNLLYLISSLLHPIAVIAYRRNIVNKNMKIVFPEMSRIERIRIIRRFYRNILDMAFEVIRMISMKPEEINDRVQIVEDEVTKKIRNTKSPILFFTTHLINWEWLCAASQLNVFPAYPLYKPIKDKKFDKFIYDLRVRFGAQPISIKTGMREIKQLEGLSGLGLLADQSPPKANTGRVWAKFFGKDTSFYNGVIHLPYLTQYPCYFAEIIRVKRGYYKVVFKEMSRPPYTKGDLRVLKDYLQLSEEAIRKNPENWLWTHDRWKYRRKDFEEIIIFQP